MLLHLSLGSKGVNDETQTVFAVGKKAKAVCQDCEDSAEKDWRSENEKTGWRVCGGKEGGC